MKVSLVLTSASAVVLVASLNGGCASMAASDDDTSTTDSGSSPDGATGGACVACAMDSDCNGGVCAQLADSYCAAPCMASSDCPRGDTCTPITTVSGEKMSACVNLASSQCGLPHGGPPSDGGTPTDAAQDSGPIVTPDAGGFSSSITSSGGTESQIYFAVVGDTRPANEDETSSYPTTIINTIYQDINKVSPMPPFVIGTGDYQYANPTGSQGATQVGYYKTAVSYYSGVFFAGMGNHECTGYTDSNCGTGNSDGITNNYTAFLTTLRGSSSASPYYVINVNATDSSWTAKFVFVAANAWDSTQSSWLSSTLAVKTTYTFLIRHESASANTAPGVNPAETIMKSYPYTLSIVGHSHEYYHSSGSREVIVGNGGAPISTSQDYGYALVTQLSSGNIQVAMYDYKTNAADSSFTFDVTP
jgi:hypothetical protein